MLDMAVARQLKYKPGKVSAVRDFPLGCGRHAVLLNPVPAKPEELTGSDAGPELPPAQEEALLVARKPEAVELADAPELPKLQNGGMANGSARVDAGDSNPLQLKAEEGKEVVPVVMLESLESLKEISGQPISVVEQPKEGAAAEMPVYSKIFPPLKRRKISAVRDFPLGCGRNVPYMNGLVEPVVGPITSSECMSKDVEMKPAARPRPMEEGLVGIVSTEKVVGEVISSGALLVIEKGQHISAEAKFESSEKSVPNSSMVEECSEERVFARSCSEKVGPELTRSVARKIREKIQETSSKAYIMSAPKSSSDGYVVEEHHEKKTLLSSVSKKKLGVYDIKSVSKNLQIIQAQGSKPSHPDARSFAAKRVVDKEARSPAGIAKSLKQSMDLDKKVLEESEEQSLAMVVQSREESFEDYGERLIVQALMAAQNCPWSQGKRSSAVVMQSASPKNKMKKEVKALSKKFSHEEASTSKCENKVENKDDEDGMLRDEDNAKARDVYQRLCDMNVNLTPFGPSTPNQKGGESDDRVTRNKVKKALRLFQVICRKLLQGEEDKSKEFGRIHRVDLTVAAILKENKEWVNTGKPILGNVPGIEVGDEFHYRVELCIVGLHRPFQGGIDFTKIDGMLLATSIVASGGYPGDMDSSDVLIYSGSGGNPSKGKQASHQKLERGNLALKNSIDAKTPVRVIHGFKEPMNSDSRDTRAKCLSTFTYDGLYLVEQYWPELGPHGYNVFKFRLRRMPGQPELALKEVKKSKKSRVREGLCIIDISEGKEKIPICAVNTIDDDRPVPFKYTTKLVYPSWYVQASSVGCDCTDGCSDSEKCACSVKNGGEIPFNFNGAIVQAKPLVYECGPSCKCPPSCHNRVSQNGIKIPLEIFKTKSRGWGVRSLNSIPSGSFICEYVGELLKDTEAEQRSNDEYLFDIGHNYDDHSLWEGLPRGIPGLQSISLCNAAEDVGFTIDAAEYGNVGRFINHSCSPNLYAQNVLYDHDDKRMPHIMFFAADNIPPLQELTYHYNYTVDHVRDSEGNIKRKNCYCGSPECTGRLY